jgi:hypothetical protein
MPNTTNLLLVLGCSATKVDSHGELPAINLYDGSAFRTLRAFLRERQWPKTLSVGVLSAKYGLIGGLAPIRTYDERMTRHRAAELRHAVTDTLTRWKHVHSRIDLVLGKDYIDSIDAAAFAPGDGAIRVRPGPIGQQLNHIADTLRRTDAPIRSRPAPPPRLQTPFYFLPDWDDFLDVDFDFEHDRFSCAQREDRREAHSIELVQPYRLCDGVLVSLAQHLGSKGLLKRVDRTSLNSLALRSVRKHFGLAEDQWAFGDCGAFTYVAEPEPTISVDRAVAVYDLYEFDFGASVDHIPLEEIPAEHGKMPLNMEERQARVILTRDNADRFLSIHKSHRAHFIPGGVIQGIYPADYADQLGDYLDMGYRYLALGGLVPRSDAEIAAIVQAVHDRLRYVSPRPWIHLLGIFRPKLQDTFRTLGINSFDSASYFRKSWLRSGQNYLGVDGRWYAAIRVPPSHDPRTLARLQLSGHDEN